jgi:hypothetical protein
VKFFSLRKMLVSNGVVPSRVWPSALYTAAPGGTVLIVVGAQLQRARIILSTENKPIDFLIILDSLL